MPVILSALLFLREARALVALRKVDRVPYGGRWLLPWGVMGDDETAEQSVRRHARDDLGVQVEEEEFVDTLYLDAAGERFVVNVFRILRYEGTLRFRAGSDYADVRWLDASELESVDMPDELRGWLIAHLKGEPPPVDLTLFEFPKAAAAAEAPPPPPDNAAAWDAIAGAYQARYQLPCDDIVYGVHGPYERDLRLLGDVRGKRALVLGCGGGQDVVALAKMGAEAAGIDSSRRQLDHADALAKEQRVEARFRLGTAEDLSDFESRSQDLVLSVQALNYVERLDRVFAEAYRVLRPGGRLVFSVHHPFDAAVGDEPPYCVERGYWQSPVDWTWEFPEAGVSARFRSWYPPVSAWVALVQQAGFVLERLLEPPPADLPEAARWEEHGAAREKAEKVPETLIVVATKPT